MKPIHCQFGRTRIPILFSLISKVRSTGHPPFLVSADECRFSRHWHWGQRDVGGWGEGGGGEEPARKVRGARGGWGAILA